MKRFPTLPGLWLGLLFAAPLQAEQIPLDSAGINRLGLVFMPAATADATTGARFPARVITSPHAASALHAMHGGVLERWLVQPGDAIAQGDVLAIIRSQEVLTLQQQWMAAETLGQQTAIALARDQRLFADGIIARQRLQETEQAAQESTFHLQALRLALQQAGFSATDLNGLRSEARDLGGYRLLASVAGTVAHLNYQSGQMVERGDALATLSGATLWVSAELPSALAMRLQTGQPLRLAEDGSELLVRQKDQALDHLTQTIGIFAEFSSATTLLPGQLVTLLLPPAEAGIVVPGDAVVHNGNDTVVFVKTPNGIESRVLALRPIGPDYLAETGVTAGEQLVVRGASLLKGIMLGLGGE